MDQFDPNIPGLIEGQITAVAVTDPQPFPFGVGNHVLDPTKPFTLKVDWALSGSLVPLWLAALGGNWDVSAYAESLGAGPEVRLGTRQVPVNQNQSAYSAEIAVPAGRLDEHAPGTDVGGIYKIVVAVFLNSSIAGTPGFDLVGFQEGPIVQVESPA